MELSQLSYFRVVARTEHFTRAAEELHIAQPSLSKAIANLERELGVPLFDREGKRVRLSPYGAAFLEWVEQILALTDEAVFFMRDMKAGERGHVRLGSSFPITPPSPIYYYQYSFFQAHPQVSLSLSVREGGLLASLLEERELDFGVSLRPADQAGLCSRPLYTDELGIIVGPEHPLAGANTVRLEALAEEAFLCNSAAPDPNDSAHYLCAQAGFAPHVLYEGESADLIGESVAMGRGISFVSQARFQFFHQCAGRPEWEQELHYVQLENDFCTRTVYLLTRAAGCRSKAAQWFFEGLLEYLEH